MAQLKLKHNTVQDMYTYLKGYFTKKVYKQGQREDCIQDTLMFLLKNPKLTESNWTTLIQFAINDWKKSLANFKIKRTYKLKDGTVIEKEYNKNPKSYFNDRILLTIDKPIKEEL